MVNTRMESASRDSMALFGFCRYFLYRVSGLTYVVAEASITCYHISVSLPWCGVFGISGLGGVETVPGTYDGYWGRGGGSRSSVINCTPREGWSK